MDDDAREARIAKCLAERRGRETKPAMKVEWKPRRCLGCQKTFETKYPNEWVCSTCKDLKNWRNPSSVWGPW